MVGLMVVGDGGLVVGSGAGGAVGEEMTVGAGVQGRLQV